MKEDTKEKKQAKKSGLKINPDDVVEIFQYWLTKMKKRSTTKLDKIRRGKIVDRLRDGYTVAEIKTAIDNCASDPHNQGINDRRKKFDDIELICRSAVKLDFFIEKRLPPKAPEPPAWAQVGKYNPTPEEIADNEKWLAERCQTCKATGTIEKPGTPAGKMLLSSDFIACPDCEAGKSDRVKAFLNINGKTDQAIQRTA